MSLLNWEELDTVLQSLLLPTGFDLLSRSCWPNGLFQQKKEIVDFSQPSIAKTPCLFSIFLFPYDGRATTLVPWMPSFEDVLSWESLPFPCLSLAFDHPILHAEAPALVLSESLLAPKRFPAQLPIWSIIHLPLPASLHLQARWLKVHPPQTRSASISAPATAPGICCSPSLQ